MKVKLETRIQEISSKIKNMSYENLDLSNGGHVACLHVGLTDEMLIRRRKEDMRNEKIRNISTFTDKNSIAIALWDAFNDPYAVKRIAEWTLDISKSDRFTVETFSDEPIGRVLLLNGAIKKTSAYEIVLQRTTLGTVDVVTGMPFIVISMYPVEE